MALKTMAMNTTTGQFDDGWHELTIATAKAGSYNDKGYLDITFEGYPDNLNARVYEAINGTTGEEFKIANLFKYANAGIAGVLQDPSGKNPIIQYDDDPKGLEGKKVNVLFYKEVKTGKGYTRVFADLAPVEQEGEHISYTADQVEGIKRSIGKRLESMLNSQKEKSSEVTSDMPF